MAKEKQETKLETVIKADASVDVAVEQKEENLVSETKKLLVFPTLLRDLKMNS